MPETKIFKKLDGIEEQVLATSYSQIDVFLQCPYRWFRDYLLGEREHTTAEALALGSSVHETLEEYMNGVKKGREWTVGEACNILYEHMRDNNIPWLSEENKELATIQHEDMIVELAMGSNNLAEFIEDKEVVACEQGFQYKIDLPFDVIFNGINYNKIYIIGSIDCILRDLDGEYIVIDFKTGKKSFAPKKLRENLQLPIYSLVCYELFGKLPIESKYYFTRLDEFQDVEPLAIDEEHANIVRFKYGKNKGQIKQKQRCIDDVNKELIKIFERQYTQGMGAFKAHPTPLCSWCNHGHYEKEDCKYAMDFERKDMERPKKKNARSNLYR